ncbi:hypothetical protein L2E82_26945 [Cichorium intybus]|uniref:Uncharacterized protein n=1 Tax=Cichorium intybus TaxID=13427 RepID=A0ACB9CRW9_CICIN|nr:hypothetical protein L2E82_26945 [Cichorium intybus]
MQSTIRIVKSRTINFAILQASNLNLIQGQTPRKGAGRRWVTTQVVLHGVVNMQLPNQWLWDMVDEFVYQLQSFCFWFKDLQVELKVLSSSVQFKEPQI